ncbi:MAG: hypothetical protein E7672_03675 [Ruminococcaceae bacterium]|nr:hypothetical protein [Oscillospiraceae bacterium]
MSILTFYFVIGKDLLQMKSSILGNSALIILSAVLLSLLGGVLNGIFGTGSGILFMLVSRLLTSTKNTDEIIDQEATKKEMYSFSMSCVIPVSLVSLMFYRITELDMSSVYGVILPAVIGGLFGGIVKEKVKAVWLNLAFALITIYSGVSMVIRSGIFS